MFRMYIIQVLCLLMVLSATIESNYAQSNSNKITTAHHLSPMLEGLGNGLIVSANMEYIMTMKTPKEMGAYFRAGLGLALIEFGRIITGGLLLGRDGKYLDLSVGGTVLESSGKYIVPRVGYRYLGTRGFSFGIGTMVFIDNCETREDCDIGPSLWAGFHLGYAFSLIM